MVPQQLTATQVDTFLLHRIDAIGAPAAWMEMGVLRRIVQRPPLRDLVSTAVLNYLARRGEKTKKPGAPGYSDGEWTRLVTAARADVAAIRDHIDAGERLLAAWSADPPSLSHADQVVAEQLTRIAATGVVPRLRAEIGLERRARTAVAQRLFVTQADREPLLVLLGAVTGRNPETLKELPAAHRILDDRAVELRVTKRRHGPQRWFDTVTWEIGPPHRALHTPGGLYLLLHRLMARGRAFHAAETASQSVSIWSVWRNARTGGLAGTHEHQDPYAASLSTSINFTQWARRHDLRADPADEQAASQDTPPLLEVRLPRVRTSVEVRRTRAVGGHLPSAARSNTVGVLFANYLRGDPTARDWAEDVLGHAVIDAEQAALAAHHRALQESGRTALRIEPAPTTADHAHEGAWTACSDPDQHPNTGQPCRRMSFLDCFHCGNCLITRSHLPAILALLDDLANRRDQLGETDWWTRYGPAWAAIRSDVLPKFTPAELTAAREATPAEALLELAEDPWEHP
ncbi:hypothetical protein [Amycolatopsis albispora]|uniref:Uncharacterized protein n=1 Tax=Amycolatopsis albispora TaxID=1804986 RepID=A0A344LB51_9PSEU|nr:hypothetical protein [Amycolatopsis albispora]AXB45275.1 hypothetical protein A4R43_24545 [Amycolatopsis albispora]